MGYTPQPTKLKPPSKKETHMKYTITTLAIIAGITIIILISWMTSSNNEVRLRNAITAKQKDNTSQLDNTLKVISQNAQVTTEQKEAIKDIIIGNAQARKGGTGTLATLVQESVPNMDQTTVTYRQLMNTITAARNTWTDNQRQLLDLKREHDNLIDMFPSSIFVGSRGKIEVTIVTSTKADESFKTGKDDDTELFKKQPTKVER